MKRDLLVGLLLLFCSHYYSCRSKCEGVAMDEEEKEAFYQVLKALNPGSQWDIDNYQDPCGLNVLQGCSCDQFDNLWHFTSLSFGPVYDNTPSCGPGAFIHPSIAKFTHLHSLSFFNCFIHPNHTSIPAFLACLPLLRTLIIRNNPSLVGPIPAQFANLTNLQRLILTQNSLEEPIPPSLLSSFSSLFELDLSRNSLDGSLHASFFNNLSSLIILDLSHNRFQGNVPTSIGSLSSLRKLDLSGNFFSGPIPSPIGNLTSLQLLDLSNNNLCSPLPLSLLHLFKLQQLSLSNNGALMGPLPSLIWTNLTNMVSLDLSSCNFVGAIPSSLGLLSKLVYLSLSNNRFSGNIPPSIGQLPLLSCLYLDDNLLSGPLPFSTIFVQRLGYNLMVNNNLGFCVVEVFQRESILKVYPLCSSINMMRSSPPPNSFVPTPLSLPSSLGLQQTNIPSLFGLLIVILFCMLINLLLVNAI